VASPLGFPDFEKHEQIGTAEAVPYYKPHCWQITGYSDYMLVKAAAAPTMH
jgi:hypothetical protein